MPHIRSKRSNDLVFIYLDEAYSFWEDNDDNKIQMLRQAIFTSPKTWSGEDVPFSDLVVAINGLAERYHWIPSPNVGHLGDIMITGGDAFGLVHYAIQKALVGSHSLKATKGALPIINDLHAILLSRWAYADHKHPTPERTAHHYSYSAVMAAQRVQGKRVYLDLSPRQMSKVFRTSIAVNATYSDLMPEFCDLMAQSHIMHLGKAFGERLSQPAGEPSISH